MRNIYKFIISILVMMFALNVLYNIRRTTNSKLGHEKTETIKKNSHGHSQNNARTPFHKHHGVGTLGNLNDSTLEGVVDKYELQFKDNPFTSRVQLFLTTLFRLTKARQNKTLWRQLDLMSLTPFPFDPEFLNPCWWSSTKSTHPCDSQTTMLISESIMSLVKRFGNLNTHKKPFFRCLPYFYVIGQRKSGTSDLFWKINEHPDVFTNKKETQWISRMRLRHGTCASVDAYINKFLYGAKNILHNHQRGSFNSYVTGETHHHSSSGMVWKDRPVNFGKDDLSKPFQSWNRGEGTPGYFSCNDFWDLLPGNEGCKEPCVTNANIIHHITPGARLILSLRNPTDRLYSYYFHKYGLFHKPTSREQFHHLVLQEIEKFQKCLESQTLRGCCCNYTVTDSLTEELDLRGGIYHVFLSDWLKVFPRDQIHIVKFEDYAVDASKHLRNIFKFLNLRAMPEEDLAMIIRERPANRRSKTGRGVGDMWNSTRNILDQFYKPFSQRLSALLRDDNLFW